MSNTACQAIPNVNTLVGTGGSVNGAGPNWTTGGVMRYRQYRADRQWAKKTAYEKFWREHRKDLCARCGVPRNVHIYAYDMSPVYQLCCKAFKEGE